MFCKKKGLCEYKKNRTAREHDGSVVERRTPEREFEGSKPTPVVL